MTNILQKNETAFKTSKNNKKNNVVKSNCTKNTEKNNVYYSTNDNFILDKKTGLFLPINNSSPFYPLQKYHYSGKYALLILYVLFVVY